MKKLLICSLAIFIVWTIIDFIVHAIYLKDYYLQTADLWRPQEEAKMFLNAVVVLIGAVIFTLIYLVLVARKSVGSALLYGLLLGISAGISIGYGFYAFMPIPYHMAATWFLVSVGEGLIAGGILGFMAKP